MPSLPTIEADVAPRAEAKPATGAFDAPDDLHPDHHELRGAVADYALMLGDDALVLGQRLSEWCGRAPTIEVDLSLANLALDLIGQATMLLGEAARLRGAGEDADRLAFHRDVLDYRNLLIVEQPNGDFAQTIARQWLFSTAQLAQWQALTASTHAPFAAVAAKAVKEVAYHAEIAAEWVVRLGDGTDESRARMIAGIGWMARFVPELFTLDPAMAPLVERGIAVDPASYEMQVRGQWAATLAEAGLPELPVQRAILGGRKGHHSEHLGHLLATMQHLPRSYPDARW